jgi:hypothetical protein
MIYNAPAKGDDGLYFVKTLNDDKRKCLVQLNKVKISECSSTGEVVMDVVPGGVAGGKVEDIDARNLGRRSKTVNRGLVRSFQRV